MSDYYEIKFFGWFSGVTSKGNPSDKVWGWADVDGKLYNFWGRRGGKFQWKRHDKAWGNHDLEYLTSKKKDKGYQSIPIDNIENYYEDFHSEFKKQLFTARMLGKVKSEGFETT